MTKKTAGALVAAAAIAIGTTAAGSPDARAADAAESEHWYVIKIAGNPAGYVREVVAAKAAPRTQTSAGAPGRLLVTTSEMRLVLNRLGSRIELRLVSEAEESAETGRLLGTSYAMLASALSRSSSSPLAGTSPKFLNVKESVL